MSERPSWLIAGLGNPGLRYRGTRHNIGFMVVDELARRLSITDQRQRFDAEIAEATSPEERIVLLKPQTFMNLSGAAVAPAARWYQIPPQRMIVIYDELDLPFGQLRIRPHGSSGGHNGLASVIDQLGTEKFPRMRVGIGRPAHGNTVSYVLSRFNRDEESALSELLDRAVEAVLTWKTDGIDVAMNQFNRRQ